VSPKFKVQSPKSKRAKGKRLKLPFVFLNLAMTADGKIAPASRHFLTLSTPRDRQHMMELRATADAVMSGARTIDLNPVTLGTGGEKYRRLRKRRGFAEYNLRVIVSGSGSIDTKAAIFKKGTSPIIILTTGSAGKRRLNELRQFADDVIICGGHDLDFRYALRVLRRKWKVKRLLCEGGGELDDGLFRAGVVNELHLTISAKIMGGRKAPTICDGLGFPTLDKACQLQLKSMRRHEDDVFLVFKVVSPQPKEQKRN
jgi:2,5-diamino-6-(ribosylamino)-4(3H)-pyrimidinone 5'-phosphate reductase